MHIRIANSFSLPEYILNNQLIFSKSASNSPISSIYAVTGTNGADGGFKRLLALMAENGLNFYKSLKEENNDHKGLFSFDDIILIKVNSQWDQRGGTNTDLVKEIIQAIVDHPDGFNGEIIVADNGQAQYGSSGQGGSLNYQNNNAVEKSQSIQKVVNSYQDKNKCIYRYD